MNTHSHSLHPSALHSNHFRRRALIALGVTAALTLAVPLAASAHVRVTPIQANAGADDTLLTFAVPNESATATTTRIVIELPTATPFGDVSYEPVAGWTAQVVTTRLPKPAKVDGTTITEAPTSVVWTASPGTKLLGGQIQLFVVEVGPMPDTGRIMLPAIQTYSDGTVVRWADPTPLHGEEPDHPAPTVYIRDTPPADSSGLIVSAAPAQNAATSIVAVVAAVAALVVAVIALVFALAALIRSGRRGTGRGRGGATP